MENDEKAYIPKNLDETILQLDKEFDDSTKQSIIEMNEMDFICDLHFSTGMWIRNNWGLWGGADLTNYFNNLGGHHPDDMSSIILTCYYRHLKHQAYELDKQIRYYQDYLKKETL